MFPHRRSVSCRCSTAESTMCWSPRSEHAPWGGAVPIRVRGTMVGVLAVSGLDSTEDYELAVSALRSKASTESSVADREAPTLDGTT